MLFLFMKKTFDHFLASSFEKAFGFSIADGELPFSCPLSIKGQWYGLDQQKMDVLNCGTSSSKMQNVNSMPECCLFFQR